MALHSASPAVVRIYHCRPMLLYGLGSEEIYEMAGAVAAGTCSIQNILNAIPLNYVAYVFDSHARVLRQLDCFQMHCVTAG